MKIVVISDTHCCHHKVEPIPPGDLLIHAGDWTNSGYLHEVQSFVNWFSGLDQYKHKILIAGNHDITLDKEYYDENWKNFHKKKVDTEKIRKMVENKSFHYLENSLVEIEGIKFYGSPQNLFCNWAFGIKNDYEANNIWKMIPDDTNVLITHTPPYGILDHIPFFTTKKHLGCDILLIHLDRVKPKYHIFGHIHECGGSRQFNNGTIHINGATVDGKYNVRKSIQSFVY